MPTSPPPPLRPLHRPEALLILSLSSVALATQTTWRSSTLLHFTSRCLPLLLHLLLPLPFPSPPPFPLYLQFLHSASVHLMFSRAHKVDKYVYTCTLTHSRSHTHTHTLYTHVCAALYIQPVLLAETWSLVLVLVLLVLVLIVILVPRLVCSALLCSLPVLGWGSSRATHVRLKVFSERLLLLPRRRKPCGCLILSLRLRLSLNASPSCSQDNGSLCDIVTNDARRRPCRLPNDQSGQSCHHTTLHVALLPLPHIQQAS